MPIEEEYGSRGEESSEEYEEEAPITYDTMAGVPLPNSMRVIGHIGCQKISILIDTGATHNFINNKVADKLNIRKKKHLMFEVTMEDGTRLPFYTVCPDIDIKV